MKRFDFFDFLATGTFFQDARKNDGRYRADPGLASDRKSLSVYLTRHDARDVYPSPRDNRAR